MLRVASFAIRNTVAAFRFSAGCANISTGFSICNNLKLKIPIFMNSRPFSAITISNAYPKQNNSNLDKSSLLQAFRAELNPCRTVTKFSLNKGKRKSVKAVIKRFKRLHWGGWIRTRSGRHKKMWKKSPSLQRRLRQHVLVNATQSWLLDKMVTKYWRRPKHYIDDPYAPYHVREEYPNTRRNPIKW